MQWCQGQKRPTPRFKPKQEPDGTWSCKVVLPDIKDKDRDVVVFYAGQGKPGAPDEGEALQRAAVAGLFAT